MALLWTDGFDKVGAVADLDLWYTRTNTAGTIALQAGGGLGGGNAVRLSNNQRLTRTFPTAAALTAGGNVHVGFWMKQSAASGAGNIFFQFGTNQQGITSGDAAGIRSNADGSIDVTIHGNGVGVIATSAAGVLTYGTAQFIEYAAKWNTSGNGGFCKVWVNGNLVINFSGTTLQSTAPTTWTAVGFRQTASGFNRDFDDLMVWDEVGSDFALTQASTSYLPVIETLDVTADDAVQFTPSAGSNFQNVDDAAFHDGDTTYNSSATVGHVDLFGLEDPATTPAYVFATTVKTIARIDVAGTVNLRSRVNSSGTVGESADHLMTTSYVGWADFWGKDPNTSAVWGTTQPAAIKVGYEFQS